MSRIGRGRRLDQSKPAARVWNGLNTLGPRGTSLLPAGFALCSPRVHSPGFSTRSLCSPARRLNPRATSTKPTRSWLSSHPQPASSRLRTSLPASSLAGQIPTADALARRLKPRATSTKPTRSWLESLREPANFSSQVLYGTFVLDDLRAAHDLIPARVNGEGLREKPA